MKYRFTDGIVYTNVCKVHLLIATRKVWDKFPSIKEVSAIDGCFCQGIKYGMDEDELIKSIVLPPKMKKETLHSCYQSFIDKMLKSGYLIPEDSNA